MVRPYCIGDGNSVLTRRLARAVKQDEHVNGNGTTAAEDTEMKPAVKAEDDDVKMIDATTALAGSPASSQLFIKAISPEISRKDLEAVCFFYLHSPESATYPGHPQHCAQCAGFEYLALSEPNMLKNFQRVGWVHFATAEQMADAAKVLCESTVRPSPFLLVLVQPR